MKWTRLIKAENTEFNKQEIKDNFNVTDNEEFLNNYSKDALFDKLFSKDYNTQKEIAKLYWTAHLKGVDDLEDFAGEDDVLMGYAQDNDVYSMAEYLANKRGSVNNAINYLRELEEYDINELYNLLDIMSKEAANW